MIRCDEVTKIFRKNGSEVTSLDRFTAEVADGEFVAVRGPSGSGKTTLLLTLGGMQRPSDGSVQLAGRDLYALSPAERARLRSSEIGFVFQMFHLVPYLDLLGNVLLACPGKPSAEVRQRAGELMDELGSGRSRQPSTRRTQRRGAAASGRGPCVVESTQADSRRRADRQSRPGKRGGSNPALGRVSPRRWHGGAGDPWRGGECPC